jgi:hypothetical protein
MYFVNSDDIWSVVVLLSESRAIINGLDVILHSVMLQIIYSTVYRVKRLIEEEQTTQWTKKKDKQ